MTLVNFTDAIADPALVADFDPTVDRLDMSGVGAADIHVTRAADSVTFSGPGGYVTLPITYDQLVAGANVSFADGSLLIIGDNTTGIAGDTAANSLVGAGLNDQLHGLSGADTITGGEGDNLIYGNKDNDVISTGIGADSLYGGQGADMITDSGGANLVYGNLGDDQITTGGGADTIYGGQGDDVIIAGDGADWIFGNRGIDTLTGGAGADRFVFRRGDEGTDVITDFVLGEDRIVLAHRVFGIDAIDGSNFVNNASGNAAASVDTRFIYDQSTDTLYYDADGTGLYYSAQALITFTGGADGLSASDFQVVGMAQSLVGGAGGDTLMGQSANDTIEGGGGNDLLMGGVGSDWMLGGAGSDTLDGGSNRDRVSYHNDDSGVNINLMTGIATNGAGDTDILISIEAASGGGGADTLVGDSRVFYTMFNGKVAYSHLLHLFGGAGDDLIVGANGWGLIGGAGNDTIISQGGSNYLSGNDGDDLLQGGTGSDKLAGGEGADTVAGGGGDDIIYASRGNDLLVGGAGSDTIVGGYSNDTMAGGAGIDLFRLESASLDAYIGVNVILDYNPSEDFLDPAPYIAGTAKQVGSDVHVPMINGAVFIFKNHSLDVIESELVYYQSGNGGPFDDKLLGGYGANTIMGGAGSDTIHAVDGDDWVFGQTGNDIIHGGWGNDLLVGDAGNDYLDGSDGVDTLRGGGGADTLVGGFGVDVLIGGAGSDMFLMEQNHGDVIADFTAEDRLAWVGAFNATMGQEGDHVVIRGALPEHKYVITNAQLAQVEGALYEGRVVVEGIWGSTELYGGPGDDTIKGGDSWYHMLAGYSGDDQIFGRGNLFGGRGDDLLSGEDEKAWREQVLAPGLGSDTMYGGAGPDRFDLSEWAPGDVDVILDFTAEDSLSSLISGDYVAGTATQVGTDVHVPLTNGALVIFKNSDLTTIENAVLDSIPFEGTEGADLYEGSPGDNTATGNGGDDTLNGGGGGDTLKGGYGNDQISGGEGNDSLFGGYGNDLIQGDGGDDTLYGSSGADTLVGGSGNDRLEGYRGADIMIGGGGNDSLHPYGNDTITGGDGGDTFNLLLMGAAGQVVYVTDYGAGDDIYLPNYLGTVTKTQIGADTKMVIEDGGTIWFLNTLEADLIW